MYFGVNEITFQNTWITSVPGASVPQWCTLEINYPRGWGLDSGVLYRGSCYLIKGSRINIRISKEFPQFVAFRVIVEHSEANITKETWVLWCKTVIVRHPSSCVHFTNKTFSGPKPVLLDEKGIKCPIQAVVMMHKPYVGNDHNMFTISLVTVQVRKAQFNMQVIEGEIFHSGSLKLPIASIMGL